MCQHAVSRCVGAGHFAAATDLFDIQNVADGVYFACARPQVVANCNAAVFVNSADVLVVDAHSKPSAAALIAQIKNRSLRSQCGTWWIRISTGITRRAMPAISTASARTQDHRQRHHQETGGAVLAAQGRRIAEDPAVG